GRRERRAVALRGDVEGHVLRHAVQRELAGEREREGAARGERQRETGRFRGDQRRRGELPDRERVLLDEVIAVALIARDRGNVAGDLRIGGERAIGVQRERARRALHRQYRVRRERHADELLADLDRRRRRARDRPRRCRRARRGGRRRDCCWRRARGLGGRGCARRGRAAASRAKRDREDEDDPAGHGFRGYRRG